MLVTTGVAAPRGSGMDCGCAAGNWRAECYVDLRQQEVWCVCECVCWRWKGGGGGGGEGVL